ncbi:hypothetical protein [Hoeflea poritis]|uniref:Uncharacterized protein n=1 Tax=Hoeflea poritis TaxID=2993659 RepID=A0ABT4VT87_9HYPH|nr:hypothetical protein [Hoeflea poritis]MDA4847915.1 hypothetical protein [Hoeflea poritis]
MYWPKPGTKSDPVLRWNRPDRIFFGYGACHVLAGVYLDMQPLWEFYAERIVPNEGYSGNHVYVTDGAIAFDFHGYSGRERLLAHHWRGWSKRYPGWNATIKRVDFDLLDTAALNARKMLGPDQYLHDPLQRARGFLSRKDHKLASERAMRTVSLS